MTTFPAGVILAIILLGLAGCAVVAVIGYNYRKNKKKALDKF